MKNFSDTNWNRTRDLPTCSAVPQPTALPRAPRFYCTAVKRKVKFTLEQATKAHKGSTLSLTSALDGVGGQRHALVALPPGKTRYS